MKTKIINLYEYEELSEKAKKKALEDYNANDDYPFLQDDLREYIHEELESKGFKEESIITPLYSLGYCQGDGLMFEGSISKDGNTYTIKHAGHYYHERSTNISGTDKDGEEIDTKDFEENIYIPLCKEIAQRGYSILEEMASEEHFIEMCDANDYTFREDGTMEN